jgi:hypothetical protein
MLIKSIQSIYRSCYDGIRVTQWYTKIDERTHREYHTNTAYTIRLYNKQGVLEKDNARNTIDVRA